MLVDNTSRRYAALAGLAAGAFGLGVAEALAVVLGSETSPLVALGDRVVDLTPAWLKDWAVEAFGTRDKLVLIGTMLVVTALLLAVAGLLGARRRWLGPAALVVLGGVDLAALLATRGPTPGAGIAALAVGLVVGCVALWLMLGRLPRSAERRVPAHEAPAPAGFDRRTFLLIATAIGAAGVAAGAGVPELLPAATGRHTVRIPRAADRPGPLPRAADLRLPGLSPYLTPNEDFYKIDISLRSPRLQVDDWHLPVAGLVDNPLDLTYRDLLDMPLVERRVTLACVSNPVGGDLVGNATWTGVRLADVLDRADVRDGADAVLSTGADGITIGTPLEALTDGRDALLAIGMNGEPLPVDHGFPVRMVVSGLYGYVSATKWLTGLEVSRFADFSAYWTQRGWAPQGPIKTGCRIELPGGEVSSGQVTVAGVAWAQHRGIGRVEVRVDGGPWQQAELAAYDGPDTWRQWRWTWDAEPGTYVVEARASDREGLPQTGEEAPVLPDGATGYPRVDVTVS